MSRARLRAAGRGDFFVNEQRLDQLLARCAGYGLSEVIGSWKIMEMRRPRMSLSCRRENGQQIDAVKNGLAAFDAAGRLRQQAHDGIRGDGFAGAGFADDAQRFAALDVKGNILHRAHDSGARVEGELEVVNA